MPIFRLALQTNGLKIVHSARVFSRVLLLLSLRSQPAGSGFADRTRWCGKNLRGFFDALQNAIYIHFGEGARPVSPPYIRQVLTKLLAPAAAGRAHSPTGSTSL